MPMINVLLVFVFAYESASTVTSTSVFNDCFQLILNWLVVPSYLFLNLFWY